MSVVRGILGQLNETGIRYAHFKSSEHLDDNFTGASDFDLLVDRADHGAFARVLMENGAKRFEPTRYGAYPGVENWLAFDAETGVLHHFHLHTRLASGISQYKDYMLPWCRLILDNRVYDEARQCYIVDPNIEILLLLTRMVIKSSLADCVKAGFGTLTLPKGMQAEFAYLLQSIEPGALTRFADAMFPASAVAERMTAIIGRRSITASDFTALNRCVRVELRHRRRAGRVRARATGFRLQLAARIDRTLSRLGRYPIRKKVGDAGGLMISLIGVDGSGKSTASREICRWLGRKLECRHAYLGSGPDGDGRHIRIRALRGLDRRLKGVGAGRLSRALRAAVRASLYVLISKRLHAKMIRINRYRLNGGIAVTDRYPQNQIPGINDGPKLNTSDPRGFHRRCARTERICYEHAARITPDIVIRMNISAETSMKRHPEQTNISALEKKIETLNEIRFVGAALYDVDAERPIDQVLSELKRIVWSNL